MIIITDPAQTNLLAARALGVVWLLQLEFSDFTYRFSSFNRDLVAGGFGWIGLGKLLSVGDLRESTDPSTQTIPVRLSVADQSLLALALGNVEAYRGRPARLYLALLNEHYQVVGPPRLRSVLEMQPVKIDRESPGPEGGTVGGSIELPLSAPGMARARNAEGQRLSYEQHWFENPGDRFLEFVLGLIKQPTPWLSKRFQQQ